MKILHKSNIFHFCVLHKDSEVITHQLKIQHTLITLNHQENEFYNCIDDNLEIS